MSTVLEATATPHAQLAGAIQEAMERDASKCVTTVVYQGPWPFFGRKMTILRAWKVRPHTKGGGDGQPGLVAFGADGGIYVVYFGIILPARLVRVKNPPPEAVAWAIKWLEK